MQLKKLLMTWNIIPGREQAYIEFNAKVFVPKMMEFGLHPMDSWFTQYGDAPQVTVGWVADDSAVIRRAIESEDWLSLQMELDRYVSDFTYKIVPVTGRFQL